MCEHKGPAFAVVRFVIAALRSREQKLAFQDQPEAVLLVILCLP